MRLRPAALLRAVLLAIASLAILAGYSLVDAPDVRADCGRVAPPKDLRAYRGIAFTGRLASLEPPNGPSADWTISFDVDEVLAGAVPDPFALTDSGGSCGTFVPERLRAGQQVLMSVGGWDAATPGQAWAVLMWRRTPNGWRFASEALWGGRGRGFPPAARAVTTREAITRLVGGPALPPIPPGPELAAAQDVDWTPVDGVLGGAVQGLRVDVDSVVAWGGRFWALENQAVASSSDDERISWHEPAVWRSSDGREWLRSALPRSVSDDLTLVAWGDRLALVEQRHVDDPPGIHMRVWTWDEDEGWIRGGRLRVRPEGRYRGCGFTNQLIATTARTLVVTASCLPPRGSGGWVVPALATLAAAQPAGRRTYPTYSWTSTDGRNWTAHRLVASSDELRASRIVGLWSVGTGVAAVVDRGTRQDLRSSADGARFGTVAAMPVIAPDITVAEVLGVTLVPRDDGRVDWLLLLAHLRHDADRQPVPGTGINLWRLDPEGSWTVAQHFGGDASFGSLATDGTRVAVVVTEQVPDAGGPAYRRTSLSADGGRDFVESDGAVDLDYECQPSLAMVGIGGVTTCYEPAGPMTRRATLWSEAAAT